MEYEVVIGLEVHTEMLTESKMFCACPVLDYTRAAPNIAVCPVCAGMPGVLPVINQKAVEYAVRVGLALECEIAPVSIFARKNYFYPDLPKGYQISQFEEPLANHGRLKIKTSQGEKTIRILRAHLEEDAGKLTHMERDGETYSLVDLNRAGVALLEIVTEPDMRSVEEAVAYGRALRDIIRYVGVNSGDMSKGVMRFEANISVREKGTDVLNPRAEIKNLNSFRAMERAVAYQIEQQIAKMERGEVVEQETLGWDEARQVTYSQRSKEDAHDYRYFPEPDLPPLVLEQAWINEIAASLPELPQAKADRFQSQYDLTEVDANVLVGEQDIANFFEAVLAAAPILPPPSGRQLDDRRAVWLDEYLRRNDRLLEDYPARAGGFIGPAGKRRDQRPHCQDRVDRDAKTRPARRRDHRSQRAAAGFRYRCDRRPGARGTERKPEGTGNLSGRQGKPVELVLWSGDAGSPRKGKPTGAAGGIDAPIGCCQ